MWQEAAAELISLGAEAKTAKVAKNDDGGEGDGDEDKAHHDL